MAVLATSVGCESESTDPEEELNTPAACTPATCDERGAQCGLMDNGCGEIMDCGGCASPATCGGGGTPYVCEAPPCAPTTCEQEGKNCGQLPDGCGGELACGDCQPGQSCGAGGEANVCGEGTCVPRTCDEAGAQCGKISETCGGGGEPNLCGKPACTPTTCVAEGKNCGQISDGCGAMIGCGVCSGGQTCGGSGTPNVCGTPGCTPTTCAAEAKNCGEIDDGCGAKLNCGSCGPSEACGAAGTPNVCASVNTQPLWSTVGIGGGHACAVTQQGALYCWGDNTFGQVGDGTNTQRRSPVRIGTATDWFFAAVGAFHSCAIKQNGKLYCWGQNSYKQLGDGTSSARTSPWLVPDTTELPYLPWDYISLGTAHTCAQKDNGVYCWGDNTAGQLADGSYNSTHLPRKLNVNARSFGVGWDHVCVTAGVTDVPKCAGYNSSGQLGVASPSQSNQLLNANTNLTTWDVVAGGGAHSCAVRMAGQRTLHCWGWNAMGQLGVSSAQPGTVYQVGSKTDWLMPAAGATHTCALTQTGELHCWGDNAKGALGIGGHYDQSSPQHVGPGYAFVSAGEESTCAVKLDGTLWCWGRNPWGQLGNGSTDESTTPKQVLVP